MRSIQLLFTMLASCVGCNALKSRYAMDDPVYAAKYTEGASKSDLLGKIKQAIDARHVEGLGGWYASGGAMYRPQSDLTFGGGEAGFEYYPQSWLSQRMGASAYFSESEGYLGGDTSVRAQLPTRIAPFVGLGAIAGASRTVKTDPDGIDNDDDNFIDEAGESRSEIDHVLFAVYPEVGIHAWLNSRWRATAFGRYMVTSIGRDRDDWMLGGQLTFFSEASRTRF